MIQLVDGKKILLFYVKRNKHRIVEGILYMTQMT